MSNQLPEDLIQKPIGFEDCLGSYQECFYDGYSGKPIAWGFKLTHHIEEKRWKDLNQYGKLECCYPNWYLIVKRLTFNEAVQKYGYPTHKEIGGKRRI